MFNHYFVIAEWGYFAILGLLLINSAILLRLIWRAR